MCQKLTFDGTFGGNILVVGQTRCGKTSFVQNLGKKNKIFGCIVSADWISKIELSENREQQIRQTFGYASVEFHYPNDVGEFFYDVDLLKDNKTIVNIENDDLEIEENDVLDRVIVMDNVSGLVNKSTEFSSFLTVSRKYRYTCVYIFHIIFPHMSNLQMILSKLKLLTFFLQLSN